MSMIEPYPIQRRLTQGAWMVVATFLLIALEIGSASWHLILPGGFLLAFLLTVAYNWHLGLLGGCAACVCIEILLARRMTVMPLLPLVVWAAHAWRNSGDRVMLLSQTLPGALLGGVYAGVVVALENTRLVPPAVYMSLTEMGLFLLKGVLAGAIALPILVAFLDFVAARLEINQYHRKAYIRSGSHDD